MWETLVPVIVGGLIAALAGVAAPITADAAQRRRARSVAVNLVSAELFWLAASLRGISQVEIDDVGRIPADLTGVLRTDAFRSQATVLAEVLDAAAIQDLAATYAAVEFTRIRLESRQAVGDLTESERHSLNMCQEAVEHGYKRLQGRGIDDDG